MLSSLITYVFGVQEVVPNDTNKQIKKKSKANKSKAKSNKTKNNATKHLESSSKENNYEHKNNNQGVQEETLIDSYDSDDENDKDISEVIAEESKVDEYEAEGSVNDPINVILAEVLKKDSSLDTVSIKKCINEMWESNLPYDNPEAVINKLKEQSDQKNSEIQGESIDFLPKVRNQIVESQASSNKPTTVNNIINTGALVSKLEHIASSSPKDALENLLVWCSSVNQTVVAVIFQSQALEIMLTSLLLLPTNEIEVLIPLLQSLLQHLFPDPRINTAIPSLFQILDICKCIESSQLDNQAITLLACRIAESLKRLRMRLFSNGTLHQKNSKDSDPFIKDLIERERLSELLIGCDAPKSVITDDSLFDENEYQILSESLSIALAKPSSNNKADSILQEINNLHIERENLIHKLQALDQEIWQHQNRLNDIINEQSIHETSSLSIIIEKIRSLDSAFNNVLLVPNSAKPNNSRKEDKSPIIAEFLLAESRCVQTLCLRAAASRDRVKHAIEEMKVFGSLNMKANLNECQQTITRLEHEIQEDEGTIALMHRDTLALLSQTNNWNVSALVSIRNYCNEITALFESTRVEPSDSWNSIVQMYGSQESIVNDGVVKSVVSYSNVIPVSNHVNNTVKSVSNGSSSSTPNKNKQINKKSNGLNKQKQNQSQINAMDIIVNGSVRSNSLNNNTKSSNTRLK